MCTGREREENVDEAVLLSKVLAAEVLAERLPEKPAYEQAHHEVKSHVASVVEGGIEPRSGHRHAEEGLRHVFAPDEYACEIVYDKARRTADGRADEKAVLLLVEETGKAEHGECEYVIANDGLPAPCVCAVEQELQNTVSEACQHARAEAPARAVDEYGQHAYTDGAALRQLKELDVAQHLCQSHKDCTLAESAQRDLGLVFHFSTSIIFPEAADGNKNAGSYLLILRLTDVSDVSYAGIIRIRFEGTGTSIRSVSAGNTQHPFVDFSGGQPAFML